MKTKLAFLFALCASALLGSQEQFVSIDIARKNSNLSFAWTEHHNTAVRASIKHNGTDFDLNGWDGFLVIGGGTRGLVVEGDRDGYGDFVFRVDQSVMPTNGKYTVQITAQRGYHTEEWARGTLRVNLNPGIEYLPTCWIGYERVAKLAALYVGTNELKRVVDEIVNADFDLDCFTKTNAAVVVKVSKVADIPQGARFAIHKKSDGSVEFKNSNLPDVRIFGGPNAVSSAIEILSSGAMYAPTNINGKAWHVKVGGGPVELVKIADCFATNAEKSRLIGE